MYNEEDSVQPLFDQIKKVLSGMGLAGGYEVIFVDDGSSDATCNRLDEIGDGAARVIRFENNKKKTAALLAGFRAAAGRVIVTLDGDLQDDVAAIPAMFKRLEEGYDAVVGWRERRRDSLVRKASSWIANAAQRLVLKDDFRDIGCPLRVFDRKVVACLDAFEGAHRFFPFLMAAAGFRVAQHTVRHFPRRHGRSKYGIRNRIWRAAAGLIKVRRAKGFGKYA